MVVPVISYTGNVVVDVIRYPEAPELRSDFRIKIAEVMDDFGDEGMTDSQMYDELRLILQMRDQRRQEAARAMG